MCSVQEEQVQSLSPAESRGYCLLYFPGLSSMNNILRWKSAKQKQKLRRKSVTGDAKQIKLQSQLRRQNVGWETTSGWAEVSWETPRIEKGEFEMPGQTGRKAEAPGTVAPPVLLGSKLPGRVTAQTPLRAVPAGVRNRCLPRYWAQSTSIFLPPLLRCS